MFVKPTEQNLAEIERLVTTKLLKIIRMMLKNPRRRIHLAATCPGRREQVEARLKWGIGSGSNIVTLNFTILHSILQWVCKMH